ncbi:hypothetical protein WH96_06250 [Kiloniella spongiae]|uniref:Uncharacterized protein n=1 Tax=Kiloniella spongiae TaxID=1489064 RepID=A0A0H2MHK6_9PROT|nr:hypothetical protein [Kiloniella spongiae]KLN61873.1 hypothetical protein WH96_06250 [Kiloniella spongiae]
MAAGPSGKGNADAASGRGGGSSNPDRDSPRGGNNNKRDWSARGGGFSTKNKPGFSKAKTKAKKRRGFQPTPAPEDDETFSHPNGVQSPEARREYADRYNRANGIGKYSGRGQDYGRKVPDHILQGLSIEEKKATAENIAPERSFGNSVGNFFSGRLGQNFAKAGLTINNAGELAYEEDINPVGYAAGQAVKGLTGSGFLGGLAGKAVSRFGGAISHTTSAEKVDQRADANGDNRQRAGAGVGQGNRAGSGFLSEKPLFDRAQQTLYPQQEEDKPQLGVGVSQGKSKVRRAPQLSVLNVRRPTFGRG